MPRTTGRYRHAADGLLLAAGRWPSHCRANPDRLLIQAAGRCRAATRRLSEASGQQLESIMDEQWWPAYREICSRRAVTRAGLAIKLATLLDEHRDGQSAAADDLNRSLRRP